MIKPRMIALSLMASILVLLASEMPGHVQPIEPDVRESVSWDATPTGIVFVFVDGQHLVSFAHSVISSEPAPQCNEIQSVGGKIALITGGASSWRYLIDPVPQLIRGSSDWVSEEKPAWCVCDDHDFQEGVDKRCKKWKGTTCEPQSPKGKE